MKGLRLYAGPKARLHLQQNGLSPGQWLPQSSQPVDLVGASIGAWRMATACLNNSVKAFERLERDYIAQHYELLPGQKRLTADFVSQRFGESLLDFYGGRLQEVLTHPRFRLHILTSRGRHVLAREHAWCTPLGYAGAFLTNSVQRKAMGAWLERVVFSSPASGAPATYAALPFGINDYRTRQVHLTEANFNPALQASCAIPFVLRAVHNIPGAPPGAYWDGGITDYHLHLNYAGALSERPAGQGGLVLYPHFQKAVVPGWLDKGLKWRHAATGFLDNMLLLAPDPDWLKTLPNGKLPDRTDFTRYGNDLAGRVKAWTGATSASRQLADEFADWLARPDIGRVAVL